MPRPNFEGVPLLKDLKNKYIIGAAHEKYLDYEPTRTNILSHYCHPKVFVLDIDSM